MNNDQIKKDVKLDEKDQMKRPAQNDLKTPAKKTDDVKPIAQGRRNDEQDE